MRLEDAEGCISGKLDNIAATFRYFLDELAQIDVQVRRQLFSTLQTVRSEKYL